jgi:hypothetical protein
MSKTGYKRAFIRHGVMRGFEVKEANLGLSLPKLKRAG